MWSACCTKNNNCTQFSVPSDNTTTNFNKWQNNRWKLCSKYAFIKHERSQVETTFKSKWCRVPCVDSDLRPLTHLPWTKWPPFCKRYLKFISMNEEICILIEMSLSFVPKNPIDNKSELVQVMACRQTGDKPLSALMPTQFTDALRTALGRWVN